jgi:hypothetical protein
MRDDTLLKVSTTDPWYENIINYIMADYIPPGADKKKIIRICIGCALMAYYDPVCSCFSTSLSNWKVEKPKAGTNGKLFNWLLER